MKVNGVNYDFLLTFPCLTEPFLKVHVKKPSYISFSPSHMLQLFISFFILWHPGFINLPSDCLVVLNHWYNLHAYMVHLYRSLCLNRLRQVHPSFCWCMWMQGGWRPLSQAYNGPDLKRPQRGSRFTLSTTFSVDENRESEFTEKTLQSSETHGLLHGKNQFHIHVKRFWAAKFMDGENIRAILRWFSENRSVPLNPSSFISRVM